MPSTVLIATPEHLPALAEHDDFADAQTFADSDVLRALDVITRQRPSVVALDKVFAATSRGTAFINRVKADPALSSCEIRLISADEVLSRGAGRAGGGAAVAVAEPAVAPPVPASPIDHTGTRRFPRIDVIEGIDALIDGNPATLVDLSVTGAMVLSPTILRPNQRVRMSLPDPARPIRFNAGVAWAAFELLKTGPRYRAGLEFFDADAEAVQRFMDANKKS